MNNRTRFGILGTLLIHLLVLSLLIRPDPTPDPPKPPPPIEAFIFGGITQLDDANGTQGESCEKTEHTYLGVGILFSWVNLSIIAAPEHQPAYLAGIRVGDVLTEELFHETFKPNVPVIVTVIRNKRKLTFKIIPTQICYH